MIASILSSVQLLTIYYNIYRYIEDTTTKQNCKVFHSNGIKIFFSVWHTHKRRLDCVKKEKKFSINDKRRMESRIEEVEENQ